MRSAEVIKGASLIKGVLVDRPCAGKDSQVAVHIIRGTILSIGCARIAARDAVAASGPSPPYRIAHRDVNCVRHKHQAALPDRYIYNLTSTRWHTAHSRPAVLIHNVNGAGGVLFVRRHSGALLARLRLRQRYHRKHRCQAKSHPDYCIRSLHDYSFFLRASFCEFHFGVDTEPYLTPCDSMSGARCCAGASLEHKQNLCAKSQNAS